MGPKKGIKNTQDEGARMTAQSSSEDSRRAGPDGQAERTGGSGRAGRYICVGRSERLRLVEDLAGGSGRRAGRTGHYHGAWRRERRTLVEDLAGGPGGRAGRAGASGKKSLLLISMV